MFKYINHLKPLHIFTIHHKCRVFFSFLIQYTKNILKLWSSQVVQNFYFFLNMLYFMLYFISSVQCLDLIKLLDINFIRIAYIVIYKIIYYILYTFDVEIILFLSFTAFEWSSKPVCALCMYRTLCWNISVQSPDVNWAISMFYSQHNRELLTTGVRRVARNTCFGAVTIHYEETNL